MTLPSEILLLRHAESAYNRLRREREHDPEYVRFRGIFEQDRTHPELPALARRIHQRFGLGCGDRHFSLTREGEAQARTAARALRATQPPDVLFVSPFLRARQTLTLLQAEWPELGSLPILEDERLRERDCGLHHLYNDGRILQIFHPEQAELRRLLGDYDYRFPNGENIPDVRLRVDSWLDMLARDFAGARIFAVTHHMTILAVRASIEHLGPEQFLALDRDQPPANCSLTRFVATAGHLQLAEYNQNCPSARELSLHSALL